MWQPPTLKRKRPITRTLRQIKGKRVTVEVTQVGVERVQREISRIKGKDIVVSVRTGRGPGPGGGNEMRSQGGEVTGGIPGKDSVPSLLMPGERVLTVSQNRAWKLGLRQNRLAATSDGTGGTVQLDPVDRALLRAVATAASQPLHVSGELRARRGDLVAVMDRSTVDRARR